MTPFSSITPATLFFLNPRLPPDMGKTDSPRRSSDEFIEEFSRMLINRDREFRARLQNSTEEQQRQHNLALADALERHGKVRETAEYILEKERRLQKLQVEETERLDKLRAEENLKTEELANARRRLEEKERQAQREKEREEIDAREARLEDEKRVRQTRLDEERRARNSTLEQENKARADAVAAVAAAAAAAQRATATSAQFVSPQAAQAPSTVIQAPNTQSISAPPAQRMNPPAATNTPLTTSVAQRDMVHKQYLDLHKHLKEMRRYMYKAYKQPGSGISDLSNDRFAIVKLLNQLTNTTGDPEAAKLNQKRRNEVLGILQKAKAASGPRLDARKYFLNPVTDLSSLPEAEAQAPGAFIYLLAYCAKACVKALQNSSSTTYNSAEPIGITLALIFGHDTLRFHGESFIDMVLAKLHKRCPILFGIYGPESTNIGRDRLGWPRDSDGPNGFIDAQTYYDEMSGLATGWAALTLRDFKKARSATNSCPPWHYWRTIACLVNTPPADTTPTHFVVLKGLLEHYGDKFTANYGQAATVAMRKAIVEFPQTHAGQSKGNMVQALALLRDVYRDKYRIQL
jgi:nucleoporin GLE1